MSAAKRSQPEPGEFSDLVRFAAAVAEDSDPDEVQAIADRDRDDELWPSPGRPMAVARDAVQRLWTGEEGATLAHWRGDYYRHTGTHWAQIDKSEVRRELYLALEHAQYPGKDEPEYWNPGPEKLGAVVDALGTAVVARDDHEEPDRGVVARNGVVEGYGAGRKLVPHTPDRFNLACLPYDYDPEADCPLWDKFLEQLWPDDQEPKDLLGDWLGYLLSGKTSLEKMLVLIGPKRGGKGTIARIAGQLLGPGAVSSPTLQKMSETFGLQSLIDKPLVVVGDADHGAYTANKATALIKGITGEDEQTISRKFKSDWIGKLPVRFMLLANMLPAFNDPSGALGERMMPLVFTRTFAGHEDPKLFDKLCGELPGILNFSLRGLDRLNKRRKFWLPRSSLEFRRSMDEAFSPVQHFVNDRCVRGNGLEVMRSDLYDEYVEWCRENGHRFVPNANQFGQDLRSILPKCHGSGNQVWRDVERTHYANGERVTKTVRAKVRLYYGIASRANTDTRSMDAADEWLMS